MNFDCQQQQQQQQQQKSDSVSINNFCNFRLCRPNKSSFSS